MMHTIVQWEIFSVYSFIHRSLCSTVISGYLCEKGEDVNCNLFGITTEKY